MTNLRGWATTLRFVVAAGLGLAVVAGCALWCAYARLAGPIETGAGAENGHGDVERGRILATQTLICTECHAADLGGGIVLDSAPGLVVAPNLTVRRSFTDWDRAVRHGVDKKGRPLIMMPSDGYSRLSLGDLRDLVAYLDQVPHVTRDLPSTNLSPLGVVLAATGALHVPALTIDHGAVPRTVDPPASDASARGAYLLDVSGCRGCHGSAFEGRSLGPDLPVAPPLTSEILLNRGRPAFMEALTEGRRHDGAALHAVMPWRAFAQWPPQDLDAVWQALTDPGEHE
jgi:mono/diheme cytochrome c family protein